MTEAMNSFYGGKCWECKKLITKTGESVLLYCHCLSLVCQDCARNQIMNRKDTYESYLICPLCNLATDLAFLIMDSRKAKDQESKLLKSSFQHYHLKAPSMKRATVRSFQKLISTLYSQGFRASGNLLEEKNPKIVSLKVAQLELQRLQKIGKANGFADPLSIVYFKSNVLIEKVIMSIRGDCSFIVNNKCTVCDEAITKGRTVLMTCNCRNTHLCLCCVYQILANQDKTYAEGIRCPTCKKSSMVISGVDQAREMEQQLVMSAFKYFEIKAFKGKMNEVQELHSLYSLFATIGLRGTADPQTFHKEEAEHTAKATTVAFLRLEIARLEMRRQRNLTSSDVFNPHLFLGPMSCLRFFEHKFLDVFLEPEVQLRGTYKRLIQKHWLDEPDDIHVEVEDNKLTDHNEVQETNKELERDFLRAYEARDTLGYIRDDASSTGTVYEEDYESAFSDPSEPDGMEDSDNDSVHSVKVKGSPVANGLTALSQAMVKTRPSTDSSSVSSAHSHPGRAFDDANRFPLAYASSSSVPSEKVTTQAKRIVLPANISKALKGKSASASNTEKSNARQNKSDSKPSLNALIRKRPILVVSDDDEDSEEPRPVAKKPVSTAVSSAAQSVSSKPDQVNQDQRQAMDILRGTAMVVNVSSQLHTTSFDISAATSTLKASASSPPVTAPPAPPTLWPSLPKDESKPSTEENNPTRYSRFEPLYSTIASRASSTKRETVRSVYRPLESPPRQRSSRSDSRDRDRGRHRSPPHEIGDRRRDDSRDTDHPVNGHYSPPNHKFFPGDSVEVFTPPNGTYEGIVHAYYDDNTYDIDALDGGRKRNVEERLMRGINPYGVSSVSSGSTKRPMKQKKRDQKRQSSPSPPQRAWKVGDRVEVENGSVWYPGTVDKIREGGRYDINYLDGMTESDVDARHIRSPLSGSPSRNRCEIDEGRRSTHGDYERDHRGRQSWADYSRSEVHSERTRSYSPSPPRYAGRTNRATSVRHFLEEEIGQNRTYSTPMYDRESYRRGSESSLSHRADSPRRADLRRRSPHHHRDRSPSPRPVEPIYSSAASSSEPPGGYTAAASTPARDLKKPPIHIVHRKEKGGVKEHVLTTGIFYSYPSDSDRREKLVAFTPAKLPDVKPQERNLRALCKELDFVRMAEYVFLLEAPDESKLIPPNKFIVDNNIKSYTFKVRVFFEQRVVDKHKNDYSELFKAVDGSHNRFYCESVITTYSPQSTVGMLKRLCFIQLGFEGKVRDFLGSEMQVLNQKLTLAESNLLPGSTLIIRPKHFRG